MSAVEVAKPREPCWAIADRIRKLSTAPVPEMVSERRDRHAEARELQQQLAADFGRRHGWQLSPTRFFLTTLARGGVFDRDDVDLALGGDEGHEGYDHPYFYRVNRRARALAVHLYDAKDRQGEILTWAKDRGLQASFPDYPSWWYPGQTTLVLYERVSR